MNKTVWSKTGNHTVKIEKSSGKLKKITGTRLGAIVGDNPWKTDFQAWCEICRVAEPPFEGNKYTEAGKTIEPKLIAYCKDYVSPFIKTPTDVYGDNFFEKTYGNFFTDDIFGGMWDALYSVDGDEIAGVIEAKTSSRPQDWTDGVPAHYAAQGLLYAYLLGVDTCQFVVAFLDEGDYDDPTKFSCTDDNTCLYELKVTDEFVENYVEKAKRWWKKHVDGGISPQYDDKKDKEYLDLMQVNEIEHTETLDDVLERLKHLDILITSIREGSKLDDLEKEQKILTGKLKEILTDNMGDDGVSTAGKYTLKRYTTRTVDSTLLKKDGVYDKYTKERVSYRLTQQKGE